MPSQLEIAESEALKLEPEERVRLADRLIASVFGNAAVEDAWGAEVEARIEAIETGRADLVPAADAIARARSAIK
jgi:putative addiction module component (TIGR02574 family)